MSLLALKTCVLREEVASTGKGEFPNTSCQELSNLFYSMKPPVEQGDCFPSQAGVTGKARWQSPPKVQLPDRTNTSVALSTQGVPSFYPFVPAAFFGSCLDSLMVPAAIVIPTLLLCCTGTTSTFCSFVGLGTWFAQAACT